MTLFERIKQNKPGNLYVGVVMVTILILIGGGCELTSSQYEVVKQLVPERGASPFPTIEADGYRNYSTGMRGKGAEGDSLLVDWERLKEEIKPMQDQLGREHIAFYSQYDPDSDQYTYSPHGLIFSDEAIAQADGKSGLILYEIQNSESKHLNKVVLINAPISRQAIDEMRIWARGSGSSPGQQNARTSFMSNSVDGGSYIDCGDYATWVDGMGCVHDEEMIVTPEDDWMDDPFFNPESLDEEDDSGGFYPPQPDDTDCEVAYGCGGGVGPGPVPESDPCDGDDPPLYCECEDTGNVVFDNQTFKMGLEDLWNKQLDSNKEQGSFFYENELTGDWQFFELIEPWVKRQTLTRLEFSVPSGLPEGSIYIHTHPTRSSLENYGITREYIHGPSDPDRKAMVNMNNKHGVEYGVIIDPDYRILIGPDGNEITREDRCGY